MGVMVVPLRARGETLEGRRLSGCSLRFCSIEGPATDISAPESGRAGIVTLPFSEATWTIIVGAGSNVCGTLEELI